MRHSVIEMPGTNTEITHTNPMKNNIKIAILDDYQNIALSTTDWSQINSGAKITVFSDHLSDINDIIARLLPFNILCVMRERTPLDEYILSKLFNLKLIVSTGPKNASIDITAAEKLGIEIRNTGIFTNGAPELTWALLLGLARKINIESANVRNGGWQSTIGSDIEGRTIGIIGLGNIGSKIAVYAKAFGMKILAWSENLTAEKADEYGATLVSKETLMQSSDYVTIHLPLSERSRGIVSERDIKGMKPTAYLINTSRGPLIDQKALIKALEQKRIAGAALDVFDIEPLPSKHPFRTLENVLATPHIGFVTERTYSLFFEDSKAIIASWLEKD